MTRRYLPWSSSCFVCGDENHKGLGVKFCVEGDTVVLETVIDTRYEGFPGHLHGGVISALMDEAAGWACTVSTGHLYYTVQLSVRFSKPVPGGEPIIVTARCDGVDVKLARGSAWISDQSGTELAVAQGTFFPLPTKVQENVIGELKMPGRPAQACDLGKAMNDEQKAAGFPRWRSQSNGKR